MSLGKSWTFSCTAQARISKIWSSSKARRPKATLMDHLQVSVTTVSAIGLIQPLPKTWQSKLWFSTATSRDSKAVSSSTKSSTLVWNLFSWSNVFWLTSPWKKIFSLLTQPNSFWASFSKNCFREEEWLTTKLWSRQNTMTFQLRFKLS